MEPVKQKERLKRLWGTNVWIFFHTLAEKIHEDKFLELGESMFSFIYRICEMLPCDACSVPATRYLNNINFKTQITCKDDFKSFLVQFHNFVNMKTNAPIFSEKNLHIYSQNTVMDTHEKFLKSLKPRVYIQIPYNERHAKIKVLLEELESWLITNETVFL